MPYVACMAVYGPRASSLCKHCHQSNTGAEIELWRTCKHVHTHIESHTHTDTNTSPAWHIERDVMKYLTLRLHNAALASTLVALYARNGKWNRNGGRSKGTLGDEGGKEGGGGRGGIGYYTNSSSIVRLFHFQLHIYMYNVSHVVVFISVAAAAVATVIVTTVKYGHGRRKITANKRGE